MLVHEIYHPHPKTIKDDALVRDAMEELMKDDFNGLIVVNDKNKVIGVLALQDIAGATIPPEFRANISMASAMFKKGFFKERCQEIMTKGIQDIMRKDFVQVNFQTNIMAVTADFLKNDLYIVPVIENNELVGIVTRTQIKQALAAGMDLQ